MKRAIPFSLGVLALIVTLGLALSLSFAPTLAQDGTTPTPDPGAGGAGDTGADTGDMGAQPGGPVFIGGAESSPAVQTVLNYFQTFDPNLLSEAVQYRDFTQQQGLTTREDVLGAANYLNTAFTEQNFTLRRVLTAENTVVIEFDFSGTNTGAFLGAEPTQQTVTVPMVAIIELGGQADMAAEGEQATEEAAEGADQTGETDPAQAAQQITRFDLYYDANFLAQQLGFTLQGPGMGTDGLDDQGGDDTGDADTEGDDLTGLAPSVTAEAQTVAEDGTVTVARITSSVNGWVDIHADDSGAPGAIIGFAQIAAGETLNVPVPIDSNAVTATLYAMLHQDAGEIGVHEFPGPDVPMTDAQGNVVVMSFQVAPPEDTGQPAEMTATATDETGDTNGDMEGEPTLTATPEEDAGS